MSEQVFLQASSEQYTFYNSPSWSQDRSGSRGRYAQRRSSVSFKERNKRDDTPGAGMKNLVLFSKLYHKIYETDKFFKTKGMKKGQFIIVDSGCP